MKPYLIGIAGPSGAGKTYLAEHIASELGNTVILPLDAYYPPLDHLSPAERQAQNFDDPAVLDSSLLIAHATALAQGHAIAQPVYDFAQHTRTAETRIVRPKAFVILEGIFTLHWAELRELLRTRVFVDIDDSICLERRVARDVAERGRTRENVEKQFRASVLPMAQRYVRPSEAFAQVVVRGDQPIAQEVAAVRAHIERNLASK